MPTRLRKLAPILNWALVSVLIGALAGVIDAVGLASSNAYFQEPMRNLAGRVIEIGALRGAGLGLIVAVAGLLVFFIAWPVGRMIFRSSRTATIGAAAAIPTMALLAGAAFWVNVRLLPSFLSVASLLGNAALIIVALVVWRLAAKRFARHEERLRVIAGNGAAMATMAVLLVLVLGLPVALAQSWKVEAPAQKPNVLIVLIDALRADRLGAYGYSRDTSPNLDKLASEGTRFDAAIAQASWTKPSIASMLTGLYARQTSVSSGTWAQEGREGAVLVQLLAAKHVTLAEQLAAMGYETGAFGENHHLVPELGFSQGYLRYDWKQPAQIGPLRQIVKRFESRFIADWINDHFFDWLDAKEGRKFFAYLHHIDVHWPYESPAPFSGMFTSEPAPENFNRSKFMPDTVERLREGGVEQLNPATLRAMSDAYDEGIRFVDDRLGKVFDELRRRGVYDDTLIIVTADHGEEFLEHGLLGHGESLYDEVIRVPLIVKFPCPGPHCAARVVNAQVELVDIFPTVLGAVGADAPANLVGRNLADPASESRTAYSELTSMLAMRTPQWKWIYDERDDTGELFDLAQDPGEANDLAASEPALRELLSARALDFAATHQKDDAVSAYAVEADERMLENLKALGYVK
jgi:arylsulfatase A-like enzyme